MFKSYPPKFCRKVLDLFDTGSKVFEVAVDLNVSDQTIHSRRRQYLIDRGRAPGISSSDFGEIVVAHKKVM